MIGSHLLRSMLLLSVVAATGCERAHLRIYVEDRASDASVDAAAVLADGTMALLDADVTPQLDAETDANGDPSDATVEASDAIVSIDASLSDAHIADSSLDALADARLDAPLDASIDARPDAVVDGATPMSPCLVNNGGCDPLTTCTVSIMGGGVVCGACPAGYTGTGNTSCVDVDECANAVDPCPGSPYCLNTTGSYECHDPIAISANAGNFSCALFDDGAVKCWGNNASGQLGIGDVIGRGDDPSEMGPLYPTVNFGSGNEALEISVGATHACAVLKDLTLKCWGDGGAGALGSGSTGSRGLTPSSLGDAWPIVDVGTARTVLHVSSGQGTTCAVLDNGALKCWGGNQYGRLGLGDVAARGDSVGEMGDALPSVNLGTGRTAKQVSVGATHVCAILDNNTLKCWGNNSFGQLGLGDTQDRGDAAGEMGDALPIVNLGTGRIAVSVWAGSSHTCALLDNNATKCWGINSQGTLGLGDSIGRGDNAGEMGDALPAVSFGSGFVVSTGSAGWQHNCAVINDAAVRCWGYNSQGQLGYGDTANRGDDAGEMGSMLPSVSLGFAAPKVLQTCSGNTFSCALSNFGDIKCWGYNGQGQLGIGATDTRGDAAGEMGSMLPFVEL